MNTAPTFPQYSAIPISQPPAGYAKYKTPEQRARNRFLKALALVVVGLFAWHLMTHHQRFGHGQWGSGSGSDAHEDGTSCVASQFELTEDDLCADWVKSETGNVFPFTVSADFNLPVSSDRLFVISQGALAHGSLKVTQGDEESDQVAVHVVAGYYTAAALARAKVCALHRDNDDGTTQDGLGIFTPSRGSWHRQDQLEFTIHVTLPASGSSPLDVKQFDTDLHNFRHGFSDLADSVSFHKLSVHGSNARIEAESLSIEKGALKTSNGGITGKFRSDSKLELTTSNGVIRAEIDLHNADEGTPSELILKTSNGALDGTVSLHSTAREDSRGGAFDVSARTSNSHLKVRFPTAPVDSILSLDARTSNSAAHVALHPTYEGSFHASTSNSPVSVLGPDSTVQDPSGQGRLRVSRVAVHKGREAEGEVFWGTKKVPTGEVEVKTSNSPVVIQF